MPDGGSSLPAAADDEDLLTLREVRAKVGLGASTIYRRMGEGTFPLPRNLGGGTVRWMRGDIRRWAQALPIADTIKMSAGADPG